MVIEIQLKHGLVTEIDEEDVELIKHNWCVDIRKNSNKLYYVSTSVLLPSGLRKKLYLHRAIMKNFLGRDLTYHEKVDHINHNGLDNRRSNLRLATIQENQFNRQIQKIIKSSQYKGVSWDTKQKRWRPSIKFNSQTIHLGSFIFEEDAARAYDKAAKEFFGKFCCLNFPGD